MESVAEFVTTLGLGSVAADLEANGFQYAIELSNLTQTELTDDYNIPEQSAQILFNEIQKLKNTEAYEVVQLLQSINMSQYLANILSLNVDSFDTLCQQTEQDFIKCGIKNVQHRKTLVKAIDSVKEVKRIGAESISSLYNTAYVKLSKALSDVVERAKVLSDFLLKIQNVDKKMVDMLNSISQSSASSTENLSHSVMEQLYIKTTQHPIISVFGDVKAGKSTFINCLLGSKIVASDFKPCTSMISVLSHSDKPLLYRYTKDGKVDVVQLGDAQKVPTDLVSIEGENRQKDLQYVRVEIKLNIEILKYVNIVDTPGLNEKGELDKHVFEFITKSDALVFIINASSTVTNSLIELIEYVRKEFTNRNLQIPRIFVLVNKIDALSEDTSKEAVLEYIARQFKVMFPELKQFRTCEYIHGISASKALACLLKQEKPPKEFENAFHEIVKFFSSVSKDKMKNAFTLIHNFYNKICFTVDSITSLGSMPNALKIEKLKPIKSGIDELFKELSKAKSETKHVTDNLEHLIKEKLKEIWHSKEFLYELQAQQFEKEDTDKIRSQRIAEFMSNYISTIFNTSLKAHFEKASTEIFEIYLKKDIEGSIHQHLNSIIRILQTSKTNIAIDTNTSGKVLQQFSNSKFHKSVLDSASETVSTRKNNVEKILFVGTVVGLLAPITGVIAITSLLRKKEFSVEESIIKEYSASNSIQFQASQLMKSFKSQINQFHDQLYAEVVDAANMCNRIKNLQHVNPEIFAELNVCANAYPKVVETILAETKINPHHIRIVDTLKKSTLGSVEVGIYNGDTVSVKRLVRSYKDVISEAYLIYSLVHENIIEYVGFCKYEDNSFSIVTKFHKQNLKSRMEALDLTTKSKILHQIVEGIGYLHHCGVIHGNINLETIHLTQENVVKIAGIRLNSNMSVSENIDYIAPEIQQFFSTHTTKSDIFSFGVLAFEFLTVQRFDSKVKEYPTEMKEKLPSKVVNVLTRCFVKDPEMRPTIKDILQMFDTVYATDANGKSLKSIEAKLAAQDLLASPASPDTAKRRTFSKPLPPPPPPPRK